LEGVLDLMIGKNGKNVLIAGFDVMMRRFVMTEKKSMFRLGLALLSIDKLPHLRYRPCSVIYNL
jgi:hypothetical protein